MVSDFYLSKLLVLLELPVRDQEIHCLTIALVLVSLASFPPLFPSFWTSKCLHHCSSYGTTYLSEHDAEERQKAKLTTLFLKPFMLGPLLRVVDALKEVCWKSRCRVGVYLCGSSSCSIQQQHDVARYDLDDDY